ncbi:ClpP/crotonase-like domain-containing protein [Zopfochytrium polystomum]|nr:ClpP/crotonase-like domain-containing protein [Zopfochytrium polystomum]
MAHLSTEKLEVVVVNRVATVAFNNPRRANSLSRDMCEALEKALVALATDDSVHVLVLTGKGKYFCSGMDLGAASSAHGSSPFDSSVVLFEQIANFPKPTIALLNGPAIGGGVGIAFCTDLRIMHSNAYIQLAEVKRGLIPAIISLYIVPKVGPGIAGQWFLTGEKITPERLYAIGAVAATGASPEALQEVVDVYAEQLKEGGPSALRNAKDLVRFVGGDHTAPEKRAHVKAQFENMMTSDEAAYGMGEFLSKRKPNWAEYLKSKL